MIKFLQDIIDFLTSRNARNETSEINEQEKSIQLEDTSYIVDEKMPLLLPMLEILDKKNINRGVTFASQDGKLYCCFERECLSEVNQFILLKIASVYSNIFSFSDEKACPIYYDNIEMSSRYKKLVMLELPNDDLTILGTTIMLANCLQEQDPLKLKINQDVEEFSEDDINRHNHYNNAGCPDTNCISLSIALNKDNPLRDNPYAPFFTLTEINNTESGNSIVDQIFVGYDKKRFVTFNMDKENLEEVVKEYLKTISCNINSDDLGDMSGVLSLLGEKNKQLEKKIK